jgi:Heparinase II/III-like protein
MAGSKIPIRKRTARPELLKFRPDDRSMSVRRRQVAAAAMIFCATALLAASCTAAHGALPTAPRRVLATAPSPATRACGALPGFDKAAADALMAGRLTLAPFPAVTIDPHRDGDINWQLDPFGHPTWFGDFQSGGWIEMLVSGYLAGGPGAQAYRARAKAITMSWLRGVPVSVRYPGTLICVSEAFPGQRWIQDQIVSSVDYYAAHWMGAWNHGLKQDLELLRIGCGYPVQAFGGAALRWRQTAVRQMIAAFEPNRLGPEIDTQGAVNEQSTLYEDFVYYLWQHGLPELAACGYRLPGWIMARIARMPAFLGYATQPDGYLVQIGDTYVERPLISPRQPHLVAVYTAGYVFGRSGLGPGASFYSLRFGPRRQVHGHDDHMSLTYYARGRNLIVNAGHTGYENTPYRAYLRSPEASSVLVMPGVPFDQFAPTSLVSDQIGRYGQFYEFFDTAFGGNPRYRSVYVSQRPDLVLVFDRAWGSGQYQQLWHLDPALRVTRLGSSYALASAPGTDLLLKQIPLPGQVIPPGSTQVVRGQVRPYQGWVSHQMLQRIPADVVTMTTIAPSAAMLTLIVPAAPGTPTATAISGPPGGPYQLRVRVGATVASFSITAGGVIS